MTRRLTLHAYHQVSALEYGVQNIQGFRVHYDGGIQLLPSIVYLEAVITFGMIDFIDERQNL